MQDANHRLRVTAKRRADHRSDQDLVTAHSVNTEEITPLGVEGAEAADPDMGWATEKMLSGHPWASAAVPAGALPSKMVTDHAVLERSGQGTPLVRAQPIATIADALRRPPPSHLACTEIVAQGHASFDATADLDCPQMGCSEVCNKQVAPVLSRVLERSTSSGTLQETLQPEISERNSLSAMLSRVLARGYAARRAMNAQGRVPGENTLPLEPHDKLATAHVGTPANENRFALPLRATCVEETQHTPPAVSARGCGDELRSPSSLDMLKAAGDAVANWPLSARAALQHQTPPVRAMPRVKEEPREGSGSSRSRSDVSESVCPLERCGRSSSPAVPSLDMSRVTGGRLRLQQPLPAEENPLQKTKDTVALLSARNVPGWPATASGMAARCLLPVGPPADCLSRTKETLAILSARAAGAPVSPLFTMGSHTTPRTARGTPGGAFDGGQLTARGRTLNRAAEMTAYEPEAVGYHLDRIRSTRQPVPHLSPDALGQTRATVALLSARLAGGAGGLSSSRRYLSSEPASRGGAAAAAGADGGSYAPLESSTAASSGAPFVSRDVVKAVPAIDLSKAELARRCPYPEPSPQEADPLRKTKETVALISARHGGSLTSRRRSLSTPPCKNALSAAGKP